MDSTMELVRMKSKLAVYRNGLHRAKEKGDMDAARDWLNNMVELKKEIARLSSQLSLIHILHGKGAVKLLLQSGNHLITVHILR